MASSPRESGSQSDEATSAKPAPRKSALAVLAAHSDRVEAELRELKQQAAEHDVVVENLREQLAASERRNVELQLQNDEHMQKSQRHEAEVSALSSELQRTKDRLQEKQSEVDVLWQKSEKALAELYVGKRARDAEKQGLLDELETLRASKDTDCRILATAFQFTKNVYKSAESHRLLGSTVRLGTSVADSVVGKATPWSSCAEVVEQASPALAYVDKSVITPVVAGYRQSGAAILEPVVNNLLRRDFETETTPNNHQDEPLFPNCGTASKDVVD